MTAFALASSGLAPQSLDPTPDLNRIADSLESVQITWLNGLAALAALIAGIIIARIARSSIRALGERTDLGSPQTFRVGGRFAFYGIILYAIGAAMGLLGFDVVPFLSMLGLATVVLALGLRPLFENIAAGITLQTRRPFDVGDQVLLLGSEGTVREVNGRSTVVETTDGELVHIPNRQVLDSSITNFTAVESRRSTLDIGLDYDTDLGHAEEVMLAAARETPGVRPQPEVRVFVYTFADSTINAAVWFWHEPEISAAWAVRHAVAVKVKRALDDAGITIAFPQRVLWRGDQGSEQPAEPAG